MKKMTARELYFSACILTLLKRKHQLLPSAFIQSGNFYLPFPSLYERVWKQVLYPLSRKFQYRMQSFFSDKETIFRVKSHYLPH